MSESPNPPHCATNAIRAIVDGTCNSAGTLVLGIVPFNRICVAPRRGSMRPVSTRAGRFGIPVTSQRHV
jgi:hypothetical protein